jgi:hypothetical protein
VLGRTSITLCKRYSVSNLHSHFFNSIYAFRPIKEAIIRRCSVSTVVFHLLPISNTTELASFTSRITTKCFKVKHIRLRFLHVLCQRFATYLKCIKINKTFTLAVYHSVFVCCRVFFLLFVASLSCTLSWQQDTDNGYDSEVTKRRKQKKNRVQQEIMPHKWVDFILSVTNWWQREEILVSFNTSVVVWLVNAANAAILDVATRWRTTVDTEYLLKIAS